ALRLLHLSVADRLRDGGRGRGLGHSAGWLRQILVLTQVALTLVVLVAAGLLTRSLREVENADLGFTNRDVLLATANLPDQRFPTAEQRVTAIQKLQDLASGFPGVDGAAVINIAPFSGADNGAIINVLGRPEGEPMPVASIRHVSANYFSTLGIPLLRGRLLTEADRANSQPVAVIDSHLAETYWPNQDPLGQQFVYGDEELTFEVVGIAKHMRHDGLQPSHPQEGFIYIPLAQEPQEVVNLLVDSVLPQESLAPMLRGLIEDLAPEMPVEVRSLPALIRRANAGFSTPARLSEGMALLAALLAAVGIYSLIAVMVRSRAREIGIRLTLGSRRRQILALLTRRALLLVAGGIVAGLVLSWWLGKLYLQTWSQLLYRTSPHDPLTYAAVSVLFLALALLASWIPSRRALRIDPAQTLREE
ncbi:MAG TPA: FtsX-like permease family protein, partial [Acidobacteriota bacterium]|nr:FtsX-like permease family protein [Acidobacteriota bacterium]